MTSGTVQGLFWIALGGLFVPIIARRLKIPSAVGELIYGILCGPHILKLISPNDFIEMMGDLGLAFLMFSVGLGIDFGFLRTKGRKIARIAVIWLMLVLAAALGGGHILGLGLWAVLGVCVVSIGLTSVILRERKWVDKPLGQVILAAGLIGEAVSIFLWTLLDLREQFGWGLKVFYEILQFTGIFVMAYLMIRLLRLLIWLYPRRIKGFLEGGDHLELGVRLAMALLFVFLAAASFFGVEAVLGTFVAGALFSFVFAEREILADKVNSMCQGLFVPIFFIVVGSHFDPRTALESLPWLVLGKLVLLALTAKILPSLLFLRAGLRPSEVLAAGLLFSMPLSLTVAVAEVGGRLGALSADMKSCLILLGTAMGLVCPFLVRLILPERGT